MPGRFGKRLVGHAPTKFIRFIGPKLRGALAFGSRAHWMARRAEWPASCLGAVGLEEVEASSTCISLDGFGGMGDLVMSIIA